MCHISKNRKDTKLKFCIRNGFIAMTHAKFPIQIGDKFDFWDVGLYVPLLCQANDLKSQLWWV